MPQRLLIRLQQDIRSRLRSNWSLHLHLSFVVILMFSIGIILISIKAYESFVHTEDKLLSEFAYKLEYAKMMSHKVAILSTYPYLYIIIIIMVTMASAIIVLHRYYHLLWAFVDTILQNKVFVQPKIRLQLRHIRTILLKKMVCKNIILLSVLTALTFLWLSLYRNILLDEQNIILIPLIIDILIIISFNWYCSITKIRTHKKILLCYTSIEALKERSIRYLTIILVVGVLIVILFFCLEKVSLLATYIVKKSIYYFYDMDNIIKKADHLFAYNNLIRIKNMSQTTQDLAITINPFSEKQYTGMMKHIIFIALATTAILTTSIHLFLLKYFHKGNKQRDILISVFRSSLLSFILILTLEQLYDLSMSRFLMSFYCITIVLTFALTEKSEDPQ